MGRRRLDPHRRNDPCAGEPAGRHRGRSVPRCTVASAVPDPYERGLELLAKARKDTGVRFEPVDAAAAPVELPPAIEASTYEATT